MHFREWKVLYFDCNFIEARSPVGLGDGLEPNRRQAIVWTNADWIHWRIYAALGADVLIAMVWFVFYPKSLDCCIFSIMSYLIVSLQCQNLDINETLDIHECKYGWKYRTVQNYEQAEMLNQMVELTLHNLFTKRWI